MSKVTCEFEFGDSVIVVLRTTVQAFVQHSEGVDVVTDDGTFSDTDNGLVAIFPDPGE